jgi:hypothetical protein
MLTAERIEDAVGQLRSLSRRQLGKGELLAFVVQVACLLAGEPSCIG